MARMPAADRRQALLEAAFRVIAREGVSNATTRAIVGEAGMALASFHYAFESRDAMLRALIPHVLEGQTVAAFSSLHEASDIESALRVGLQAFLDLLASDPGREQVVVELTLYALRTPEISDLSQQQYTAYRAAVSGLLETAADAIGVAWLAPLDDVARIVVTFTDGITLAWLSDRDTAAARRVIDFAAAALAALTVPVAGTRELSNPPSTLELPNPPNTREAATAPAPPPPEYPTAPESSP